MLQAVPSHDDKTGAIDKTPLLVEALSKQLPGKIVDLAIDVDDGHVRKGLEAIDKTDDLPTGKPQGTGKE